MCLRGFIRSFMVCAVVLGVAGRSVAQTDLEPNDSLEEIQSIGVVDYTTVIESELTENNIDPGVFEEVVYDYLAPGATIYHDFFGLPPNTPVMAFIDNQVGVGEPDTMLRSFDEFGDENGFNDDGSLVGGQYASGLVTNTLDDGSLRVQLTGYPDEFFTGAHEEFGDYAMYVKLGPFGDRDFYRFTGLVPGSFWEAETGELDNDKVDTLLSWYGSFGEELNQNDDILYPDNLFSQLSGEVPEDGTVILAVSAYPDFLNVGAHVKSGRYTLTFTATEFDPHVTGDTDADGDVDLEDLNNVRNNFGTVGAGGDADLDGDTDLDDLNAVRNNFGAGGASAVPEPTGLVLAGVACAVLGMAHGRRRLAS